MWCPYELSDAPGTVARVRIWPDEPESEIPLEDNKKAGTKSLPNGFSRDGSYLTPKKPSRLYPEGNVTGDRGSLLESRQQS